MVNGTLTDQSWLKEMEAMSPRDRAKKLAFAAHADQSRDDGQAYIVHPSSVVDRIEAAGCSDERVICAAWLHDVVEDTEWTSGHIEMLFGEEIAEIVDQLTLPVPDRWPHNFRQGRELKTLALMGKATIMSPAAKVIKIADRIDNLSSAKGTWKESRLTAYAVQADRFLQAMELTTTPEMDFYKAYQELLTQVRGIINSILQGQ